MDINNNITLNQFLEAFGKLNPVIGATTRLVRTHPIMASYCSLAWLNLAISPHVRMMHNGLQHPASLYVVLGMESGEGKSESFKLLGKPFKDALRTLKETESSEDSEYRIKQDLWDEEYKKIKSKKTDYQTKERELIEHAKNQPQKPKQKFYYLKNATVESFEEMQTGNPNVGWFTDEVGKLLDGYSHKNAPIDFLARLTEVFDGEDIHTSTISRGSKSIIDYSMSLLWLGQPVILRSLWHDKAYRQGFLARCLYATIPYEDKSLSVKWKLTDEKCRLEIEQYYQILGQFINPVTTVTPVALVSVPDAVKRDMGAIQEYIKNLARDEFHKFNIVQPTANRVCELAARIGYTLQCYEHGILGHLDKEFFERGLIISVFNLQQQLETKLLYQKSEIEEGVDKLMRFYHRVTDGDEKNPPKYKKDKEFTTRNLQRGAHLDPVKICRMVCNEAVSQRLLFNVGDDKWQFEISPINVSGWDSSDTGDSRDKIAF